jgi:hypothetical protein
VPGCIPVANPLLGDHFGSSFSGYRCRDGSCWFERMVFLRKRTPQPWQLSRLNTKIMLQSCLILHHVKT